MTSPLNISASLKKKKKKSPRTSPLCLALPCFILPLTGLCLSQAGPSPQPGVWESRVGDGQTFLPGLQV